jgi:uncharacterized protein (TIGR04255 family)
MSEARYNIDDFYPNQQLVEVSCDIRFPVSLEIQNKSYLMQKILEEKYPDISILKNKKKLTDVYKFEDSDKSSWVIFSNDRFSFSTNKYKGHKDFIKTFLDLSKKFKEYYNVKKILRLGWRYVNVVPFVREKGLVPISNFFKISLNMPKDIPDQTGYFNLISNIPYKNGEILFRLSSLTSEDGEIEALLLDHDFALNDFMSNEIEVKINDAHIIARDLFEKYITDNYRKYLKGENVI